MFFKKDNRLEALVGSNTEFKGEVTTKGTLRIDGKFIGDIRSDWVIVGSGGEITGNTMAKSVVIGGRIRGNVRAEDLVEIKHNGQLMGDIYTKKLSVAEGGVFEGYSHIQKDETKIIDFPNKEAASSN